MLDSPGKMGAWLAGGHHQMSHPVPRAGTDVDPVTPPRSWRRLIFPMTGALLIVAAVIVAWVVLFFVSLVTSVCNDAASVVIARRHELRRGLLLVGLAVAAVPVVLGFMARERHRRVWPWAVLAALFMFIAVRAALTAQPELGLAC